MGCRVLERESVRTTIKIDKCVLFCGGRTGLSQRGAWDAAGVPFCIKVSGFRVLGR